MSTDQGITQASRLGADEINRLHAESVRLSRESRDALHAALTAAWSAGRLLLEEKRRVRRTLGRGAWQLWLRQCFSGSPRTAQRYMLLARNVADVSALRTMSLRQVYFRLGIATEPKSGGRTGRMPQLPKHTSLAIRLLGALKADAVALTPETQSAIRQDLRPLYERLRVLFEAQPGNSSRPSGVAA